MMGYNVDIRRQISCLVFNPVMVDNYAFVFYCTSMGQVSDSMKLPT